MADQVSSPIAPPSTGLGRQNGSGFTNDPFGTAAAHMWFMSQPDLSAATTPPANAAFPNSHCAGTNCAHCSPSWGTPIAHAHSSCMMPMGAMPHGGATLPPSMVGGVAMTPPIIPGAPTAFGNLAAAPLPCISPNAYQSFNGCSQLAPHAAPAVFHQQQLSQQLAQPQLAAQQQLSFGACSPLQLSQSPARSLTLSSPAEWPGWATFASSASPATPAVPSAAPASSESAAAPATSAPPAPSATLLAPPPAPSQRRRVPLSTENFYDWLSADRDAVRWQPACGHSSTSPSSPATRLIRPYGVLSGSCGARRNTAFAHSPTHGLGLQD